MLLINTQIQSNPIEFNLSLNLCVCVILSSRKLSFALLLACQKDTRPSRFDPFASRANEAGANRATRLAQETAIGFGSIR